MEIHNEATTFFTTFDLFPVSVFDIFLMPPLPFCADVVSNHGSM